jgi:hypothetical protein
MAALWALIAVLAGVTSLNLLLTLALVRRLRGIESGAGSAATPALPEPGLAVGDFAETTAGGEPLTQASLGEDALVAFLSPECGPCRTAASWLLANRDRLPPAAFALLAADSGDPRAQAFAAKLATAAAVAFVEVSGPASEAFGGIQEFPTLIRVEHGIITAAEHEADGRLLATPAGSSLADVA